MVAGLPVRTPSWCERAQCVISHTCASRYGAETWQAYDKIYSEFDPAGSGVVTGNVFAQNLARTQLPNNVLSQIWSMAHTSGSGNFSKDDVYLALKLAALAQNGQEVRIENISIPNIPAPRMRPLTAGACLKWPHSSSSIVLSEGACFLRQHTPVF